MSVKIEKTPAYEAIDNCIKSNKLVLYMKGTPDHPLCGFSMFVSDLLQSLGANFVSIDVMKDEEIRCTIKQYSDWQTIPQLYCCGEFIGGCDIVRAMSKNGELEKLLKKHQLIK